jgi:thioredoxin-related protein
MKKIKDNKQKREEDKKHIIIGTDTYFLCHRLCKDIKGDKRTGYLSVPA